MLELCIYSLFRRDSAVRYWVYSCRGVSVMLSIATRGVCELLFPRNSVNYHWEMLIYAFCGMIMSLAATPVLCTALFPVIKNCFLSQPQIAMVTNLFI